MCTRFLDPVDIPILLWMQDGQGAVTSGASGKENIMPIQVAGVVYKNTPLLTGIEFDHPAISSSVFFNRDWLQGHGVGTEIGDLIVLSLSNAADVTDPTTDEVEEIRVGMENAPPQVTAEAAEVKTDDDRFAEFFDKNVAVVLDGRLTSDRVWKRWADENGAPREEREIAGIAKSSMASRIGHLLSPAPRTKRGRVDGRGQYYWPGQDITVGDETAG